MKKGALFVKELKLERRTFGISHVTRRASSFTANHQKTARAFRLSVGLLDQGVRIGAGRISGVASQPGVRIDQCSAGKFFDAAWIDRMVCLLYTSDAADE